MAFVDSVKNVWNRLNVSPFESDGSASRQANLANGGHTGYQPVVQEKKARREEKSGWLGRLSARFSDQEEEGGSYDQPFNPPYQQQFSRNIPQQPAQNPFASQNVPPVQANQWTGGPIASAYNGFQAQQAAGGMGQNGFQAPQAGTGFGQTGYQAPQSNTGFAQSGFGQTGYQAPQNNTGFAQSGFGQTGYQAPQNNTGFAQGFGQTGYQAQQSNTGFAQGFGQTGFQQAAAGFAQTQSQQQAAQPQQPQATDNVAYMPDPFVAEDGLSYRHVERLASITRLADCYRLMEFMRAGESVIVCMDLVQDERERTRCADLLFGAAYTMDCTLTRISLTATYIISPRTVLVRAFRTIDSWNERDASARWPGADINARGSYHREEAAARRGGAFRPQAEDGAWQQAAV